MKKNSEKKSIEHRRTNVPHCTRPEIRGAAHVVLRIRRGLPGLRTPRAYRVLERAFRLGKKIDGYRLIEFSVQQDHIHLIVEAEGRARLSRGMQGLMIRIAKALNVEALIRRARVRSSPVAVA
jgi:putative transposase